MAGASDKARFFLEKSVPELREFERKGIFSKNELSSIVKRRSDFEHTLNARGSQVSDYVRYAEYEMNLEALRRKRVKRLGVRSKGYDGQRRTFSILNRATQKFHGDVGLWILYVDYARKQQSNKKVAEVMTKMLRMHPTKSRLWIYAAKYALEEKGDMMEARNLLQRGLRFCGQDEDLWLQYGRLEMLFIAKIVGRRQILGLEAPRGVESGERDGEDDTHSDILALPTISAEEFAASRNDPELPVNPGSDFKENHILGGAMPMAVFDAAVTQFGKDSEFAIRFFDMVEEFDNLTCRQSLLNYIMDALRYRKRGNSNIFLRYVKQPLIGIKAADSTFPLALGTCLSRMQEIPIEDLAASDQIELHLRIMEWLLLYLGDESLDPDLRQVLVITLPKIWQRLQANLPMWTAEDSTRLTALFTKLDEVGLKDLSDACRSEASELRPVAVLDGPSKSH